MKKTLPMLLAVSMLMAFPALAEESASQEGTAQEPAAQEAVVSAPRVVTTSDGVLSMQLPDDNWKVTEDSQSWFVVTDGSDSITIDHLSNGESLPNPAVADNTYGGVFQAYISNNNEVFVVKGLAKDRKDLKTLIQAAGTVTILKADTKTAVQKEAVNVSEFGLRAINATYYAAVDDLNVRTGCSANDPSIGTLNKGDAVEVLGMVTKNGQDYGWYQISFNGTQAYVSASFLSEKKPEGGAQDMVYCEYCGEWYEAGNVFRNHVCPNRDFAMGVEAGTATLPTDDHAGMAYCPYCGEWYEEGNVFRNHVCPNRDMALHADDDDDDPYDDDVDIYDED